MRQRAEAPGNNIPSIATGAVPSNKIISEYNETNVVKEMHDGYLASCQGYAIEHYTQQQLAIDLKGMLQDENSDIFSVECRMAALNMSMSGCGTVNLYQCILEKYKDKLDDLIGKQIDPPSANQFISAPTSIIVPPPTSMPATSMPPEVN